MIAAAIYRTRWEKNRKEKENKTLHGLSRRWAGQRQPRHAPGSAVTGDCCFGFAEAKLWAAAGGKHLSRLIHHAYIYSSH